MISYKLAKKLQGWNFPKPSDWEGKYYFCECIACGLTSLREPEIHLIHYDNDEGGLVGNDYGHRFSPLDIKWVHNPSLAELIDACGTELETKLRSTDSEHNIEGNTTLLFNLSQIIHAPGINKWCAEFKHENIPTSSWIKGIGDTSDEALANLWLKVNGK